MLELLSGQLKGLNERIAVTQKRAEVFLEDNEASVYSGQSQLSAAASAQLRQRNPKLPG